MGLILLFTSLYQRAPRLNREHKLKGKYTYIDDLLFILFGFSCFTNVVQIQTSETVGQPYSNTSPNGECSLLHGFECAFNQDTQKFTTNALNMHSVFSNGTFSSQDRPWLLFHTFNSYPIRTSQRASVATFSNPFFAKKITCFLLLTFVDHRNKSTYLHLPTQKGKVQGLF